MTPIGNENFFYSIGKLVALIFPAINVAQLHNFVAYKYFLFYLKYNFRSLVQVISNTISYYQQIQKLNVLDCNFTS